MPPRATEIRTRQAQIRTDLDALETQLAGDDVDNVEELQIGRASCRERVFITV